jgi:hypothetical protein
MTPDQQIGVGRETWGIANALDSVQNSLPRCESSPLPRGYRIRSSGVHQLAFRFSPGRFGRSSSRFLSPIVIRIQLARHLLRMLAGAVEIDNWRRAISSPIHFRRRLDRLCGHLQSGQDIHLLTAVVKGNLLPHRSLHTKHPGREFHLLDVQFDIGRECVVVIRADGDSRGARFARGASRVLSGFGLAARATYRV